MGTAQLLQEPPDVEILVKGDPIQATVGPILKHAGWRGGLWVQYVPAQEDFVVEASDGNRCCGFILFQSEDYAPTPPIGNGPGSPENWTSFQYRTPLSPGVMLALFGNNRAYFKVYETISLNGGTRSGPPIVYVLNEPLKVSENGYLCNDSDVELALAGVITPQVVGIVSAVPSAINANRLGVDIRL